MDEHDDSTAKEIARDLGRVLPLVGCPRWLLWLGVTFGVVVFVVAKRLIPRLGDAIIEAWKRAEVKPAPAPISDGGQASDRDLPPAREGGGEPGGSSTGGNG